MTDQSKVPPYDEDCDAPAVQSFPEKDRAGDGPAHDTRGAFLGVAGYGCMLMASGRVLCIHDPKPKMFCLEDIAHHLSLACRWACATRTHYSVAQHSMLVASMVPLELKPAAMLHDAHEAVMGDKTRPFKQIMPPGVKAWWNETATGLDRAICAALEVDYKLLRHPAIKAADLCALAMEGRDLVAGFTEKIALPHTNSGTPLPDVSGKPRVIPMQREYCCALFVDVFRAYKRLGDEVRG